VEARVFVVTRLGKVKTVVVLVCGAMSRQMSEERRISRHEDQDTTRQDKQR
jgi:hypothetical protein